MNWILIGAGIFTIAGLIFIFKKFKVGKEDLKKLKNKFKKKVKISEEEQAFREGKILLPLDPRDIKDIDSFKKSTSIIQDDKKREEIIQKMDSIDKNFKKWDPEKRYNFEKVEEIKIKKMSI